MAFKGIRGLLTPGQIDQVDRTRDYMASVHAMDNLALGQEIMRLAHEARRLYPEQLHRGERHRDTYTTSLFWDVAPEVARRLGVTVFGQTIRDDVRKATDQELRNWVGSCIGGTPWSPRTGKDAEVGAPLCPWQLLKHEAVNGNPLAIGVDRLHPATEYDRNDILSRAMNEVSSARGFEPALLMWNPEMDNPPAPANSGHEVADDESVAFAPGI
jgi:hypothetical protein